MSHTHGFPRAHRPAPSMDIWDEYRDTHVILALTPDECEAAIVALGITVGYVEPERQGIMEQARKEIRLCLRDQHDIEHA